MELTAFKLEKSETPIAEGVEKNQHMELLLEK